MGLSDMTIMGIAGHVSTDMLEHYSHIRLDATLEKCVAARSWGS